MNKIIIDNILFLTHDKWLPQMKKENRIEFEKFLIAYTNRNPDALNILEELYNQCLKQDKLLLKLGVIKVLKDYDIVTYNYVNNRLYSINKKNNK